MVEHSVQNNVQPDGMQQDQTTSSVAAPMVERAFRLLDLLSFSEEGLTLSDLARALGMSKGSVHGLLKTLESNRVVEQVEDRRYILGPRIFDLAQAYGQRPDLRRFALPVMRRLAASISQTVFLGRVEEDRIRILECIEDEQGPPSLRISARRGGRIPLLAGATARVALATWPLAKRETFLRSQPLPAFTDRSITDVGQFLAAIEETARSGIGEDHEEYLIGVNAIAVPIYGSGGLLVALLWIAGFAADFGETEMQHARQQLRAEAEAISQSLGAR
ncbi:MAG TPA: IclR family transcriptional regulator [Ktedonobacterales bacterium]|nr:IclR family transcriptional regulator [Ktedonobacterales bacterium]